MDSLIQLLSDFHFIRPAWLLGLLVLLGVGIRLRKHPPRNTLDDLIDDHLQSVVLDDPGETQTTTARALPGLICILLLLALAGPTWERLPQPLYQLQQGRVIVLSLAKSMDRNDMQPSRLDRAKFKVEDLLNSMPGVLTGLVGFAGEAFTVTPLSDDQDTISNLLQSLDSDTLPVQGIQAERGLEKARALLTQVQIDAAEIILVTDRASPLAVSVARDLSNESMHVSVLEIAPENDHSQSALLKSIAQSGRGRYTRITPDDSDIRQLNGPIKTWLAQSHSDSSETLRKVDQWQDLGPWLLIPALVLSSLVFRKGLLSLLLIGTLSGVLGVPKPALAFDWQSLWERKDQQQRKAVEAYHNNDMHTALEGFMHDKTATGAYNRGNALANSQQLEAALEAYDEALRLQTDFEDARYNHQVVAAALKQQQQQQKEQQDKQSSEPKQQQDSEPKQDESQQQDSEPKQDENQQQGDKQTEEGQSEQESPGQQDSQQTESDDAQNSPRPGSERDQQTTEQNEQNSDAQQQSASGQDQDKSTRTSAELNDDSGPMDEDAQALELMLRQVPDDPGALLRRKFKYQYEQQQP